MRAEAKGRLKRYLPRDTLGSLWTAGRMYIANPAYRGFLKRSLGGTQHLNRETLEHMGCGLYVGRKEGGYRK